jgi:Integrase zinc binding domain
MGTSPKRQRKELATKRQCHGCGCGQHHWQQEAAASQIQQWAKDHGLVSINHHWFKGAKLVVADDLSLQQSILCMYHDHESAGHLGIFNMYTSLAWDYWWPDMK